MTQAKNFAFGDDETMLRDSAEKFLKDQFPTDKLHHLVAGNSDPHRQPESLWDREIWQHMIELGWTTVIVPEADGGMGMSLVALTCLIEQAGKAALPSPFIATANATLVLRECNTPASHRLLAEIAAGKSMSLASI